MLFFSIAFVLVFLSGSEATLPNIGSCTFMQYFCDTLKCKTAFFKELQKDPKGDCSAKFNKMISCNAKTGQICQSDTVRLRLQIVKEDTYCLDGGFEAPILLIHYLGLSCSYSFSSYANACLRTFKQKFAADKSDPTLCPENAKAKRCINNLIRSECFITSSNQELLELTLQSDYNPYCADGRDPGATGNEQCYGVKPLNNPLNSGTATSIGIKVKISALQALLSPFLLMMFFVKM